MSKDAPDPPDYAAAAELQGETAERLVDKQTLANRPNQYTPWGSSEWTQTPAQTAIAARDEIRYTDPNTGEEVIIPAVEGREAREANWEQNITLSGPQQQALDDQMALQAGRSGLAGSMYDRMAEDYADPVDWSQFQDYADRPDSLDPSQMGPRGQVAQALQRNQLPAVGEIGASRDFGEMGQTLGDQGRFTQTPHRINTQPMQRRLSSEGLTNVDPSQRYSADAEEAIYGQFERRNEPRMQQQRAAQETALRNQGLSPGDEAYDYQMSQLDQGQADARLGAQYQATIGSGREAERFRGMDAATRSQEFGERSTQGDFRNRASLDRFGMGAEQWNQRAANADRSDDRRAQRVAEQSQRFGQQSQRGAVQDQRRAQQFGEDATRAGLADRQRGQAAGELSTQYGQRMQNAAFMDQQRGQNAQMQNQTFNQDLQGGNMQNQTRQAQIAEQMQRRGATLNEINAVLTGQQVQNPNMPSFQSAGVSQAPNYLGAAQSQGNYNLDQYGIEQANNQGMMSGVAGIAGSALGGPMGGWLGSKMFGP